LACAQKITRNSILDFYRKLHLSTLLIHDTNASANPSRAILDRSRSFLVPSRGIVRRNRGLRRLLTLLILLLTPLPNRARPATLKVQFRTVQAMILVEGKVNGNRATFLLDTGANRTIISARTYGNDRLALPQYSRKPTGVGMTGYSVRRPADLILGGHVWVAQPVSVMDLDDLEALLKLDFDGLLGQDILRQFRSVRIDYHTHILEMEE
jgi:Aspartyl protease